MHRIIKSRLNEKASLRSLIFEARNLKSEDGENPEYDRALIDLVAFAGGLSGDDLDIVADAIGIEQERVYCTSFCNHGHLVKTGRPVEHECYIIDPRLLRAEWDGREWPGDVRREWERNRRIVKGRKATGFPI